MADVEEKQPRTEPAARRKTAGWSPLRVFVFGAVVILILVTGLMIAIRTLLFPIWEGDSAGARQVATAQVQLSAAMTQEANPQIQTPQALAASNPTAAQASTQVAPPTSISQSTPTVTLATAGPTENSATDTKFPTPTPDQAAEIASAYKRYFDVRSEALLELDPTILDEVAAGQSLSGLQGTIEDDRAQGRALQTNVEHEQVFVIGISGDEAELSDQYRDSSIFVDPATHAPLPGQVAPDSPEVAPEVSVIYRLQRIEGVWKVVSGQRFVPAAGQ